MFRCTPCLTGPESCRRCTRPLCLEHVPFGGDACQPCEWEYQGRRSVRRERAWFAAGFALPWLVLAQTTDALPSWSARSGGLRAITTGVPMLDVLIAVTATAVFAGKGLIALRGWLLRRTFVSRPVRGVEGP